jgi:hypothetical protein
MNGLNNEYLGNFERQIIIDYAALINSRIVEERRLYTYFYTYPYLIEYFKSVNSISVASFVVGKAIAYSLMPTTMNLKKSSIDSILTPLNELKDRGIRLDTSVFSELKEIVNNSVPGSSKLLHFIRPDVYPIWDSRTDRFIYGENTDTNSLERYQSYLSEFDRISNEAGFAQIQASLSSKLGYDITAARAFEMVMYLSNLLNIQYNPGAIPPSQILSHSADRQLVPLYKRDKYTFICNLQSVTADRQNPLTLIRDGYLLSERYTNRTTVELAGWVKSRRNLLISDNGNWSRISEIERQFKQEGNSLLNKAKNEHRETGRLSNETKVLRIDLMARVAEYCTQEIENIDMQKIIGTQLQISPHYMIGMEDFTIPVLMLIGMMDDVFQPKPQEILLYQRKTANLFTRQINGEFGFWGEMQNVAKFLVLHAYDYDSAFMGAHEVRDTAKDGIAISYGAPMRSNRWITRLNFQGVVEDFNDNLPESYLVAHALTLGMLNGYKSDVPVHVLGVGTPIMIALMGFLLRNSRAVSIDSSAPIKDAMDGYIYGTRQAFLKMRLYRVAALALVNDTPYESTTPFFLDFNAKYPSNWAELRDKLGITPSTNPRELEQELSARQDIVRKFIPFFTRFTSNGDPFFWDLRVARTGHNYCVLQEIVDHIRRRRDNPNTLQRWTEHQIDRYVSIAEPAWARAVAKCYEITVKYSNDVL